MNFWLPVTCIASLRAVSTASVPLFAKCVRAGHHCAKPLMRHLGVNATARASLYVYNDTDDVAALADGLDNAADFFAF